MDSLVYVSACLFKYLCLGRIDLWTAWFTSQPAYLIICVYGGLIYGQLGLPVSQAYIYICI